MSVLMGVVGSFVAIIAFSVLLETPGKYLWQTGVVGAIGGGVYLLCTHRGVDVVPASFFSALAIAFMAHLFARIFKAPVTVFLIAGILPTVPGAGMYRIAYSIVANDRAGCAYYLLQTKICTKSDRTDACRKSAYSIICIFDRKTRGWRLYPQN